MLLRPMTDEECWTLLRSQRLCVLSLVDGSIPYAVPVFYGLDGTDVLLGISEGRKTRVLDTNPSVCITVTEVRTDGFWQSVQIAGVAAMVTEEADRAQAIQALMAHNRSLAGSPVPASAPRPLSGRIVRVKSGTVSGRMKNMQP